MATTEHPITWSEMREELRLLRDEIRAYYASKADLYRVILQLAVLQAGIVGVGVAFLKLTE